MSQQSDEEWAREQAELYIDSFGDPYRQLPDLLLAAIQRGREQARAEDAAAERKLDAQQARRDA